MNGLLLLAIAAALLLTAYLVYGRYLVKTWGIDSKAKTPAYEKEDGVDYVPSNKWEVFGHQFSSIAGAGPVTGPVLAMVFGWLPAFLWVMVEESSLVPYKILVLYTHLLNLMVNQWDKSLKHTLVKQDVNYSSCFAGYLLY